jgi:hypothetical protein
VRAEGYCYADHTQQNTSGRAAMDEWLSHRIGLYLHNTQITQETNIHAPRGIQTRDTNNRPATDLCHRDVHQIKYYPTNFKVRGLTWTSENSSSGHIICCGRGGRIFAAFTKDRLIQVPWIHLKCSYPTQLRTALIFSLWLEYLFFSRSRSRN